MRDRKRVSVPVIASFAAVAALAFAIGFAVRGTGSAAPVHVHEKPGADAGPTGEVWTCSMDPQVQLPEPGPCPICGMDLIPAAGGGVAASEGSGVLELSEAARRLARIRTVAVERREATVEVRMVGKVDYDETRIRDITAWVPGRVERMFVDYTGVSVNAGDHMVDLYSPDLIAAQDELLQAIEAREALRRSDLEIMQRTAEQTVEASRERLRLWGLLPEQIAQIEEQGSSTERMTLHSPMTGVVIEKHARQGSYVDTGSRIYTIADLSSLWVRLEAYESDLEWLHLGQEVEFTTEGLPGEKFHGRVAFVDSVLDPSTRTIRLRVNVSNEGMRLKPEMLVRAKVQARIAGGGRVFDPYLAGKWIGPMHPEIVRAGPEDCDICGMPLVPAESLGFAPSAEGKVSPLVIPASAPLITGTRAVVYVEVPGAERPTYEGREIVLGPRAGDVYIVSSGLVEGERVVVEGAFKIDSALQIQARPSMMSPDRPGAKPAGGASR